MNETLSPYPYQLRLVAKDVAVSRGGLVVTGHVNFTLEAGEALVLKGGNGVGKTSLLRGLAGLSPISEGTFTSFLDQTEVDPEWLTGGGAIYLSHNNGLYPQLRVEETLNHWAKLYQPEPNQYAQAIDFFDINSLSPIFISKLSEGQKRRLALTRLLLAKAPLWLLDEPSAGLDRAGLSALGRAVAHHRQRGGILIQTAHDGYVAPDAQMIELAQPVQSERAL